jgi:hypothetical protein
VEGSDRDVIVDITPAREITRPHQNSRVLAEIQSGHLPTQKAAAWLGTSVTAARWQ